MSICLTLYFHFKYFSYGSRNPSIQLNVQRPLFQKTTVVQQPSDKLFEVRRRAIRIFEHLSFPSADHKMILTPGYKVLGCDGSLSMSLRSIDNIGWYSHTRRITAQILHDFD